MGHANTIYSINFGIFSHARCVTIVRTFAPLPFSLLIMLPCYMSYSHVMPNVPHRDLGSVCMDVHIKDTTDMCSGLCFTAACTVLYICL